MQWGTTLAFIVIFILAFSSLLAWIPDDFTPDYFVQDAEATEALIAANLIVYGNTGSDTTFTGYSSLNDAPSAPQWNVSVEGEYLEVWFGDTAIVGYALELRHVTRVWGLYWKVNDMCQWYNLDGVKVSEVCSVGRDLISYYIPKDAVVDAWNSDKNMSAFSASCAHISVSIVLSFNDGSYDNIGEAYDAQEIGYAISYEWEPDDSGFAIMTMLIKLLSFQGVGVGVPGILGTLIDALISALFYIAIAVVAYIVITAIIPFIPGSS